MKIRGKLEISIGCTEHTIEINCSARELAEQLTENELESICVIKHLERKVSPPKECSCKEPKEMRYDFSIQRKFCKCGLPIPEVIDKCRTVGCDNCIYEERICVIPCNYTPKPIPQSKVERSVLKSGWTIDRINKMREGK